jgi:hypothetical protein
MGDDDSTVRWADRRMMRSDTEQSVGEVTWMTRSADDGDVGSQQESKADG